MWCQFSTLLFRQDIRLDNLQNISAKIGFGRTLFSGKTYFYTLASRTNEIRLDRILQRLDDPDPTGALFGIKADSSWTDFADKEMESAIGDETQLHFP